MGLPKSKSHRRDQRDHVEVRHAQEVKAEQWVVIEHAVGRTHHSLAVAAWIPSHADARLNIVFVGLDAFL